VDLITLIYVIVRWPDSKEDEMESEGERHLLDAAMCYNSKACVLNVLFHPDEVK
jgi:hypothetical protein